MASQNFNLNLNINANTSSAQNQLKNLQKQLQEISNMKVNIGTSNLTADIEKASEAAMKLSAHLATATNPQTGNLDFTKFYTSIQKSGASLEDYGKALQNMGPAGQKAFVSLADSISKAEIPLKRTNKLVDGMWDNLKKTIGWQMSSSLVHGFIGSMQQAVGYAKDLNKSLTDIRIVTGASTDQMAQFAKQANQAAKSLSTTTTDYTKASLIYYQQGLSDQEVKARTETTIKMANATGQSAQTVSDQMTAIWNNFDNGTKSLTHYADVMTALGAATASSTDEIAEGLQKFAAISDTVGLSYEYAASALATVTSTTRESADVVGNSFKTLFSRIQGLQLGETLDDGTTLNKYSTALAKVGISIKDASGEMKDMDAILDEMGNKWDTLARDEQMALAQTVAGVRQYTQLMALMENWDQFKSNLNIANTSAGTLDAQAAIYAESWEAASDRVRASWEGLWDNLINSDGFIAALDVASGLIGMLDKMVTGLGGAGGALATFGGLITKVFNKQIASTISDVAYSIQMLNPKTVNAIKEEQIAFVRSAKAALSQDYENPLYGPEESKARKLSMENSLNASKMFLENKGHMSEEQLFWEQMFAEQAQVRDEMRIQAAREVDSVKKNISDNFFDLYSNQEKMSEHYLEDNQFFVSQDDLKNVREWQKAQRDIIKREDKTGEGAITEEDIKELDRLEAQIKDVRTADRQPGKIAGGVGYKKEIEDRAKTLGHLYNTLNQAIQSGGDPSKAEKALEAFGDAFKAAKDSGFDGETFTNMFKELGDISSLSLFTQDDNGQQVLNQDVMSKLVQVLPQLESYNKKSVEGLANSITDRILLSGNFTGSEEDLKTMRTNIQELAAGYLQKAIVEGNLGAFDDKPFNPTDTKDPRVQNMLKKQETQNKAEAAVAGAQGIMQTLAAVESFKALGHELENLGNGTTSLMSVLSSMASLSLNATSGFQGLHMAMSQFFTTLSPKAVTGWSLGIMGALAAVSLAFEAFDYFTTSAQEYATSIARSTQNLQNAATTTAEAFEQSQNDSETHLANVRKIESYSQDPSEMANAIYEANKQAIDMITKYGQNWVEGSEYTIDQNSGLIKIKESTLENVQEEKESISEDFERTANLAQATQQMESAINNFTDGVQLPKEHFLDYVIPLYEEYLSGSEDGRKNWESFLSGYKGELHYDQIIEESAKNYINGLRSIELISQQNTGKILQEQGYGSQNTQGYEFLQKQASDIYQKEYLDKLNSYDDLVGGKNGWVDQMDPEAIKMAERYLEAQGRLGVEGLKYRNGELKYYSDDTSGEQSIEWEDVKRWQAEQEAEKAVTGIGEDGKSWLDNTVADLQTSYKDIGESAEAVLSFQNFDGNLNQVSVKSLSAAYNELYDSQTKTFKSSEQVDKIQAQLGNTFEDFQQKVVDVYQPVETFNSLFKDLSNIDSDVLNMESLQNLDQNIKDFVGEDALQEAKDWLSGNWDIDTNKDGKATFEDMSTEAQNLVKYTEGIEQMLQASGLDAEGMAQAFNQIAQLDWTDDAGTNLRNIVATISNLGGDINIADWDHLRSIMQDLGGAMPDYSGTIAQLIQIQQLLNSLKSGDSVTAEINVLLNMMGIKTISDGKGGFIVTSSQEEIDAAAKSNQGEINDKVTSARNTQAAYNDYKSTAEGQGGQARTTGFESYEDLVDATNPNSKNYDQGLTDFLNTAGGNGLNQAMAESETATQNAVDNRPWWQKLLGIGADEQQAAEEASSNAQQAALDIANDMIETGQSGASIEDIQSLAATYEDAASLMEAINSENSAFRNEDGLVDSGTLEYLQTLPETSERATAAINAFTEAEAHLQELKDSGANEDEISRAQAISDEAAAYAELQTQIDAVAAARGLDADVMSQTVSQLQQELDLVGATAEQWATLAAEQMEYDQAVDDLRDNYSKLAKTLDTCNEGSEEWNQAMVSLKKTLAKLLDIKDFNKLSDAFVKAAKSSGLLEKAANGDKKALADLRKASGLATVAMNKLGKTQEEVNAAIEANGLEGLTNLFEGAEGAMANFVSNWNTAMDGLATMDLSEFVNSSDMQSAMTECVAAASEGVTSLKGIMDTASGLGFTPIITPVNTAAEANLVGFEGEQNAEGDPEWDYTITNNVEEVSKNATGKAKYYKVTFVPNGSGGGSGGGGGGGGGGGPKEPKKVAQTRRSQVVKRYKNIDAKRSANKNRRDKMSKKTDKLYGEAKITNLEKENKLLEEGLKLNKKKSEEAMKNLKLDQEALIAVGQKYGYEVKFDSEGNLENYEEILGDLYDQLHALEADNLLDESEEKIKEDIEIKREEIEGAIEDLEDTLEQLRELNNEYEEMIDEMHENDLEKITYKLEFELELNELDTEWQEFLLEQIDDDFMQAAAAMDLVTKRIATANENIEHYKQSVYDLKENIENDPNRSLITGYLEDGVLTGDEAEILKEAYSGIIEELSAIAEQKEAAEEMLISIFEGYNERIDMDMTALEHYASLLEHFGNVVDIVGQKQLGLSDEFMENMANMRISQSRDIMSAAKTNLEAMQTIRAEAEEELQKAQAEGRTNDIDYWQERLDEADTAIQEARDELVTAFENSLNAIADAFDAAMERVVDTFNNTIYAFGGLEGLSSDYAIIQETVDLVAADYQKIYELSKITRNINKTLSDSNIIAGKQKMLDLQKEINELQANGNEMSKYDLEYLQAKYELRLAEIELENAQNNKDTVRLSKDSEGNWSYIYTSSTDAVEEAQQKYEDALYNMQNLSYEYIDEMSEKIVAASQSMAEEIANIDKTKFKDEVALMEEVNRIKQKYADQLNISEEELNKALANNNDLYNQDWQLYNQKTGYAVSSAQDWIDSYRETALGKLTGSESDVSDYMDNFLIALDELTDSIRRVASDYYFNVNETMKAAGITKDEFGNFITTNTQAISTASENAKKNIETQTQSLITSFAQQADKVTDNQEALQSAINENTDILEWIKGWLEDSAEITRDQQGKDITYTYKEAAELFNSKYGNDYKIELTEDGKWSKTVEGVQNEILQKHNEAKSYEEKEFYADMYTWLTSYILPYTTSLDTGGYTGEWGNSGKLAMLHEKELVLNAQDTTNFLDALHISRDIINSMIEMNARQSSYALGGMTPGILQDMSQKLEQQVSIVAEFPNATDHNEIEEAFNNLINTASQYANKYNI